MSLLKSVSLIRRRKTGGGYVRGQWVPGESGDTEFEGTWQPASGKTLELLPEGKRNGEVYKCFAPITLAFTTVDAEQGVSGDTILFGGEEYEVTVATKWNNGLIPHFELLCTRQKEGAS